MIFRKPYAFLIKNFRKIHIVLFALGIFLLYKTVQLTGFVKDFITYVSYDAYLEPITKYTSFLFYLTSLIVIVLSAILLLLLRRKKKPWVLYVFPVITYIVLIVIFVSVQKYFASYEGGSATATARAFRDFLNMITIPQYGSLLIFLIRIIGLDLNRFSFGNDEEFLELDQADREEVEINVDFDKHIFKRQYKKIKRLLGYFYEEHKKTVNIILVGSFVVIVLISVNYLLNHKSISETKVLNANGYSIVVNESYYTNLDKAGNVLEENSSFVVLNLTVKNNSSQRAMDMSNFHLVNGKNDITYSGSTYTKYFTDIGKEYKNRDFNSSEERTFALIFKVDKNLEKDNFVLYYQQYKSATKVYLRKIKLNLKDMSDIVKHKAKNIGEELEVTYPNGTKEQMTFESVAITDKVSYNVEICNNNYNCSISSSSLAVTGNNKILAITFSSGSYDGQELIDFSINYGKIKYIDNDNIVRELTVENAASNIDYLGNYIYLKIPSGLENAKSIELVYTIRNQQYSYKIK